MGLKRYLAVTAVSTAAALFGGEARGTSVGGEIELKTPTEDFTLAARGTSLGVREIGPEITTEDFQPLVYSRPAIRDLVRPYLFPAALVGTYLAGCYRGKVLERRITRKLVKN